MCLSCQQLITLSTISKAGRAGRRGLDKVGTVIICCFGEEPPPQPMLKQMLTGSSTRLNSQFRLTYNMILNLLRVEEMSVESMIKRSFSEFATQRALTANEYPQLLARGQRALEKLEAESKVENRSGVEDIEEYYEACTSVLKSNTTILEGVKMEDASSFEDMSCFLFFGSLPSGKEDISKPFIIALSSSDMSPGSQ